MARLLVSSFNRVVYSRILVRRAPPAGLAARDGVERGPFMDANLIVTVLALVGGAPARAGGDTARRGHLENASVFTCR